MDCLPNRYNVMWFDATKEGVYDIFVLNIVELTLTNGSKGHSSNRSHEEWASELGSEDDDLPLDELGAKLYTKKACNTKPHLGWICISRTFLLTNQSDVGARKSF